MSNLEDNMQPTETEIKKKSDTDSSLKSKVTHAYIIDIVHHYFCIFHAWLPTNKDEKTLLKLIVVSMWSTLILLLLFTFHEVLNKLIGQLISFDFSVLWILGLASWLIQLICLATGYWILAPRKIETIQNRIKCELYIDTSHLTDLKNKNYFVSKFELEKIWVETVLGGKENINFFVEEVELNINSRKPTSRDIDSIVLLTLKNQYIINLLLVVLTVTLTISLSPLIPSIDDDNFFSVMTLLNLSAIYIWFLIVVFFILIKIVFMTFEWSLEYGMANKKFVAWRYEIFKDMLGRHQQGTIKKPRIRYVPFLEDEKKQAKIENESKNNIELNIVDKVENKIEH